MSSTTPWTACARGCRNSRTAPVQGLLNPRMSFDELLGRTVKLPVLRITSPGAYLETAHLLGDEELGDAAESQPILLPTRDLPDHAQEGDELEVFIYLDSED